VTDTSARRYIVSAVILLVASSAGYFAWSEWQKPLYPDPESVPFGFKAGYRLTDVEVTSIDGKTILFSDYSGRVLVVDFMAPWCNPCKEQIKVLRELAASTEVEILSINVDTSYNATYLTRFKEDEAMTWTLSSSAEAAQEYQVTGIPLILVADGNGVIRYRGYYTSLSKFQEILREIG